MAILIYRYDSFGMQDAILSWQKLGYQTIVFSHSAIFENDSRDFDDSFSEAILDKNVEFVFSLNYYPILAKSCQKHRVKYISIVYDCPQTALYSWTIISPYNFIFLFDKHWYREFQSKNIKTVYYMPLPVAVERMDKVNKLDLNKEQQKKVSFDVSFVGSMYNENHNLYQKLERITDYTKGYLEGVMQAQLRVYGYNFLEEVLSKQIVDDMYRACPFEPEIDSALSKEYVYANFFLGRKVAELEREKLLCTVSRYFDLGLYTHNVTPNIPLAHNMGPIDYNEVMPYVFKCSKINLNITLRSIQSGMPLRALDIMGAGGFLLTNYQEDFLEFFIPGEDFVYFESEEDMILKIDYYLKHENEREKIAENGYKKVKEQHNYPLRLQQILDITNQRNKPMRLEEK